MFDYSDDEVEDKFVYRRNGRPVNRFGGHPKDWGDGHREHFAGYTDGVITSDPRQKTGALPPPSRIFLDSVPDTVIPRGMRSFFKAKPSPHVDPNRRGFPPRTDEVAHPDSFFKSMKFAVGLAQFFSLLPVTGYGGPNYRSLRFRWLHWKTFYFFAILLGTVFIFTCTVLRNLSQGLSYEKAAGLVFFGSSLMASVLLLQLATLWKTMNADFAEMEFKLHRYQYPRGVTNQFKVVTCVFMMFALAEHVLSKVAQLSRAWPCARDERVISVVEAFFANYSSEVFSYVAFSLWKGVTVLVIHLLCTFTWNFADLLLALISWTVSKRFQQFNEYLFKVQGQDKDSHFWKTVRTDYNELADLTRKVDSRIQKLMLLSMGDNLYFICIQLLKGLKKSGNLYETIYFIWSIGFLIARMCLVSFTAAGIHDHSKEAKTVLYSVPESSYCAETRRFLTQLSTNDVALTGCKFFSITRGLILTIAGTVVTYEVILVQFNTGDDEWPTGRNNSRCLYF